MTIREVMKIVDGKVLVGEDRLDAPVDTACGSDLMSDVLAFVKEKTVLITGLINPHVVRTSEMLDITCISMTAISGAASAQARDCACRIQPGCWKPRRESFPRRTWGN